MANTWYDIKNVIKESGMIAELNIYDEIGGFEINAKHFRKDLKLIPKEVKELHMHINSPGGSVIEGFAIYNNILEWKQKNKVKITAYVDGWSASMASIIMMAADEIVAPENTWIMIHNPWSYFAGDASEMRKMADMLDKMKESSLNAYMRHATIKREEIAILMDEETWLTGLEAVEIGLATYAGEAVQIAACVNNPFNSNKIPFGAMKFVKSNINANGELEDIKDMEIIEDTLETSNEEVVEEVAEATEVAEIEIEIEEDKDGVPEAEVITTEGDTEVAPTTGENKDEDGIGEEIEKQEVEAPVEVEVEMSVNIEAMNKLTNEFKAKEIELNAKIFSYEKAEVEFKNKIEILENNLVKLSEEYEAKEIELTNRIKKLVPNFDVANDQTETSTPKSFKDAVDKLIESGMSNNDAYKAARAKFNKLWKDSIK